MIIHVIQMFLQPGLLERACNSNVLITLFVHTCNSNVFTALLEHACNSNILQHYLIIHVIQMSL